MSGESKTEVAKSPEIENLELNRETLQELTETESEEARGGEVARGTGDGTPGGLSSGFTRCRTC
jgi:hypothetical protein